MLRSADTQVRSSRVVRTRPVRVTVDVSPAEHVQLRRLCLELGVQLGGPPVSGQAVMRELLVLALVDPGVRALLVEGLEAAARARG